jgi:hypothetical protein
MIHLTLSESFALRTSLSIKLRYSHSFMSATNAKHIQTQLQPQPIRDEFSVRQAETSLIMILLSKSEPYTSTIKLNLVLIGPCRSFQCQSAQILASYHGIPIWGVNIAQDRTNLAKCLAAFRRTTLRVKVGFGVSFEKSEGKTAVPFSDVAQDLTMHKRQTTNNRRLRQHSPRCA